MGNERVIVNAVDSRIVHVEDVRYRYSPGQPPVLDGVWWSVEAGAFSVITGQSGTGKSTLLRCLNGLVPHFSGGAFGGDVIVAGENTRRYPTRAFSRVTGFVFQDPDAQAVSGRVDDEIAFGMEQLGVERPVMLRRVEELLDLLGISQLRDRTVNTLSGGERQRVSIAAALAMGPGLLVLDEPTSQLDPAGADDVVLTLHRLNEELGVTIVMSEHRLERVVSYADQLRVLEVDGSWKEGDPRRVLTMVDERLSPPISRAGIRLGWPPPPWTVKEARSAWRESGLQLPAVATDAGRPDAAPVITLTGGQLRYGDRTILRDVDFDVRPGEIVVLMGRNGSGKTTLLRALVGLHPSAQGEVLLDGKPVREMDPVARSRNIGFLPQRARTLLFNETVTDEVLFTLRQRNAPIAGLAGLLREFDLDRLSGRHPFDLSVGEQERLALAVTLAGDPGILMLDEPTRGLDAIRKDELAQSLKRRAANGAVIVMATHDVELAAAVATRVVILGHEEIIAGGGPRETLSGSLAYSTQVNKVFGSGYLTVEDVVGTRR
ncbi:ATP-binding cassette domain-containing protein [soil metagenome]